MERLTILSHNVFWFQGEGFATDAPGRPRPQVAEPLMEIYRTLAPDVLCLQEIQDRPAFQMLCRSLRLPGRYTPGGVLGQYGGATLWRRGRFLCDSGLTPGPTQRMWQLVEVPAGEEGEIRLCNIHLPSSRQLGAAAEQQRLTELSGAIEREPQAEVVVGDFNEPPGGPVGQYLTRQGYVDAAVAAGRAFRPTGLGGGRGDAIWIDRTLAGRLVEYGVLPGDLMRAVEGQGALSDHYPLWITLALGAGRT